MLTVRKPFGLDGHFAAVVVPHVPLQIISSGNQAKAVCTLLLLYTVLGMKLQEPHIWRTEKPVTAGK
jgi:hypothetical protein